MGFSPTNPLVWVLLSVMLACVVLWALSGTAVFILAAVLSGVGVLYVVMFTDL
jgi:hypothetical protein